MMTLLLLKTRRNGIHGSSGYDYLKSVVNLNYNTNDNNNEKYNKPNADPQQTFPKISNDEIYQDELKSLHPAASYGHMQEMR